MQGKNKSKEVGITIYLVASLIGMFLYMVAFHGAREEKNKLKIKLEQCKNK